MKYSIVIKSLKFFLLFLSISIFTILIVKSISQKNDNRNNLITFESEEVSSTTQVLKKPLFMGLDKKQKPYKISAQKATRFTKSENIFNLEKPNGEIETNSEKFYIYGNTGVFDNDDQTLLINGDVEFTNKNSIKFETSVAKFDFKKQILMGNESVIGRKNDSIIKSEGFKIINKENKVIFFGKSYLTLNN
jgi:LPS export ABC transporter protein LptC